MKPVGKPDAGNPHVRFDERGGETRPAPPAQEPAPLQSQAHDAWLELRLVDDALGITIDEPTNPTSQTGYLPIEASDLFRHGGAVARLGNAAAIFASHSMRLFQESPHLIPYRLFQLVAA